MGEISGGFPPPESEAAQEERQELIRRGPKQNVDRMVAWVAADLGLPVPDEYIRKPAEEDKSGWIEVDGELYPPNYFG